MEAFADEMDSEESIGDCEADCLPNCEETTYAVQVDTYPLNTREFCREGTESRKVISNNKIGLRANN